MSKRIEHFNFVPTASVKNGKNNIFEAAMINVGSLVTYMFSYAVGKTSFTAERLGRKTVDLLLPLSKKAAGSVKHKFAESFGKASGAFRNFRASVKCNGLLSAVRQELKDAFGSAKRNMSVFGTIVNHLVPVAAIVLLVSVVYRTASTSYGISVEYNGKELGVVADESVINDAQQVIADKACYYDTEDEIYVTASLSIKPLSGYEEVMDEVALATKMEEEIPEIDFSAAAEPAEAAVEAEPTAAEQELEGKVRAYAVTIDGEYIGAVSDTSDIAQFIEDEKDEYLTDDVVAVSFDKDVEFDYEKYVDPDEVIDQQNVIDKLTSIVSEPVYYEVQAGDSPWNIARDHDMDLDELKNCFITFDGKQIEDITEYCPIGATIQLSAEVPYLQTLVTKKVTYTDVVDYEIIKTEDPDMYKGDSVVDVKGVEGEAEVTALITYKNDVQISKEVLERTIIREPVAKEMRVGTRKTTTEVSTGSGGSGTYFWPVGGGYISDTFGGSRGHKGLDIAAPYGTPIYAAESGTVIKAGNKYDGYGNCVNISHADGNVTVYAHMSSIAINYGDYVVKGQLIGYVGSTGYSTGNHCHFEVRTNGYYNNPADYVSQY